MKAMTPSIRIHKLFPTFAVVLSLGIFAGCQLQSPKNETISLEIPTLLVRSAKIGSSQERQYMLNTYIDLKNQIYANPQLHAPRLQLARLFMLEARATGEHGYYYPAALQQLEWVQDNAPSKDEGFEALFLASSVYLSLHEFAEALELAERAQRMNSAYAQVYGALVDAHVELGNYEKAVEMADKMVSLKPDLRSYARVSYLREIHGDIAGAIYAMELAIAAGVPGKEDHAWCLLTLGDLYKKYGKWDKAAMQYTLALEARPNYPFAIAGLAEIYGLKKEYQDAEALLLQACDIIPEVGFFIQQVDLYQSLGEELRAKEKLEEVHFMLADDVAHGHNMNMEYASLFRDQLNKPGKALTYALKEYEKRPANIDVNRLLASIYSKMGARQEAEAHLLIAKATGSIDPELREIEMEIANLQLDSMQPLSSSTK